MTHRRPLARARTTWRAGLRLACLLLATCAPASGIHAQAPAARSPVTIATRAEALDRFAAQLNKAYVFPEVAKAVAASLAKNRRRLLAIEEPAAFAKAVHETVRAVAKDVHLSFIHDPERNAALSAPPVGGDVAVAPTISALHDNHGFKRVEMLDGNIGLLELDMMADVDAQSGARATAAMAFLADADAVIIDLRGNPGGSGRMNQLLSTYFFPEAEDKWLISNENRSESKVVQEWTQPYVPGKRMPNTPLYFLVGQGTGSAAEGFAYNLQALSRATVVGEPTAGGAHSGDFAALPGGFVAFIPSGRTINPLTKGNWEGAGVKPDVPVASDLARDKVLEMIWRERLGKVEAASPEGQWTAWQLAYHEARVAAPPLPSDVADYLGAYEGDRRVVRIGASLYLEREQRPLNRLQPLRDGSFVAEASDHYGPGTNRIRFVRDASGKVTGFQQLIRHQPLEVATFDYKRT